LLQDELNHPSLFWLNRGLRQRVEYPIISIVHHLRSEEFHPPGLRHLYRWVERAYLASVDGFVFNSRATRDSVKDLLGAVNHGLVAYPAGDHLVPDIHEDEIAKRVKESQPLRLLFVGNLIPRKGLDTLLSALKRIPRDGWELIVIGAGDADPGYARTVRRGLGQTGLTGQVRFTGPVSGKALTGWMKTGHLLVVPSQYEGFGIIYLEAMGFGLPVIASTAGGAAEFVSHATNGYLVAPGDVNSVANYILGLVRDRGRLLEMSLGARRTYLKHPTWRQTGERIRTFLEACVT